MCAVLVGACNPILCPVHLFRQELLDKHLYSWTDYDESQGAIFQPNLVQQAVWARTYARAVAGTPLNMSFDVT